MTFLHFHGLFAASSAFNAEAISEFSALWLDEFGQQSIPMDLLQVLCALTATSQHVAHKTPIPETGLKWKRQVDQLLETHRKQAQAWYVSLDDMVTATQRLQKLGEKDAVLLAARTKGGGSRDARWSECRRSCMWRRGGTWR